MPIYEYTCQGCETQFELLVRSSQSPQCPDCGGSDLRKQFSLPAAHTGSRQAASSCQPMPPSGCGLPQCGQGGCGKD